MSETTKCEACGHSAAHYDARFCLECGADCAATPPTPDRAAVRKAAMVAEAWVAMAEAKPETLHEARQKWLAVNDGNPRWTHDPLVEKMTRALLAAVSRPAEARSGLTFAPWTQEQVANLNAWQERGDVHPFTCGREGCGKVLAAVPEGWVCPRESCGYKQEWAHNFMADRAHPAPSGGAAAPRPEPGEVSEAMVEAGVEGWIAAINDSYSLARMEHEVSRHEIVGHILRAALAAREGA